MTTKFKYCSHYVDCEPLRPIGICASDGVLGLASLELGLHPEITKLIWQHAMRQSVLFAWDAKHLAQRLVLLLRERRHATGGWRR